MNRLTHVDESGAARMVDVSGKPVTARTASASGRVLVSAAVVQLLRGAGVPKGDTLAVARLAGIMGAKATPSLIPLCHTLAISSVTVERDGFRQAVKVICSGNTVDFRVGKGEAEGIKQTLVDLMLGKHPFQQG